MTMTTKQFYALEDANNGAMLPGIPGQGKSTPNRSLERGLDLLRAFRPGSEYLTNGDLSERTGLSKSTVSRLTQTLVRAGFLDYDPISGAYRLASSLLSLAHTLYHGSSLVRISEPLMRQVARQLQVNVGLAAADGDEMVYIESIRLGARKSPRIVGTGQRLPIDLTALGRAYLSVQDEVRRESLLEHFKARRCASRWAELSREINDAIQSVMCHGYCAASWQPQVVSIAAPLNLPTYRTHALNISLSTTESIDKVITRYSGPLLELTETIRSQLSDRNDS
ncbi:IclR family transcriptional regulator [Pseudomonas sp. Q11]|uniref:IclR family transcriptional regulator n=1 Tax=Pseudomonas sp. Q11 TaxID=2968470 RepID=UPI003525DE6D